MYYLRARFYNQSTGRFWNADRAEGGQEDPRTLHKYSYCLASPLDNTDPTGNEVEYNITSISGQSILAGARTTAIGGSARAFLSQSPWGHGGPDITKTLLGTLNDVSSWFGTLQPFAVYDSGKRITGLNAGDSWEIHDLRNLVEEPDGYNKLSFPGLQPISTFECGSGLFTATVAVNDEVYPGNAANYAIYGKMNRLVYDWMKSRHHPVDAIRYSLTATIGRVRLFKRGFDHDWTYETGATAESFATWGYDGSPLIRGLFTRPSGQVVNAEKFEWKWLPYHDF